MLLSKDVENKENPNHENLREEEVKRIFLGFFVSSLPSKLSSN